MGRKLASTSATASIKGKEKTAAGLQWPCGGCVQPGAREGGAIYTFNWED
jgi:hypothetical protein